MSDVTVAIGRRKSTASTPAGHNKRKRYQCRFLLGVTSVLLLSGEVFFAIISAAAAILSIKEGKIASTRNLKWMTLSGISFLASLASLIMMNGSEFVDEDKAYGLKVSLWLGAKSLQTGWGITLALFLISAFTPETTTSEAIQEKKD
eukprot:scaffold25678_cov137-Cylindrotheca_fusiformis.AAC.4